MKGIFKYFLCSVSFFILFIIIRNIKTGCIKDIFDLSNFSQETTNGYFKLIFNTTASIFAILIAVITFGYELLGKTSRRRKRFNILNKWWVAAYSSLAVTIILLSLYSIFTIQNLKHTNDLTTAYLISILFVSFVFLLFIFTIWLLSLSDTVYEVKKIINQNKDIEEYKEEVTNELVYYIQEHDTVAFDKYILPHLNQHSLSLIGDARDRQRTNNILNSLIKVWEAGNVEAIRVGEQQYFNSIWRNIQKIYANAAMNGSLLLHYQTLKFFIRQQIEFLAVNNSISGLTNGTKTLSAIYLFQLQKNCPPQETISGLYWAYENKDAPNTSSDTDLQWNYINNFLWRINQIQEVAIDLKSKHLFEAVKFELDSILFKLRYTTSIKLGDYQEAFITNKIYSLQTYYALMALESGMYRNAVEAYHFNVHEVADYIKDEKIFSKNLLATIEEYILTCQKNNRLDVFMTIRDLGGLGRVISMDYKNNQTVQSGFLTIVEILNKLKTKIQKESNYTENKNYNEIKQELESLKDRLIKLNDSSITNKTIYRIDKILKSFQGKK